MVSSGGGVSTGLTGSADWQAVSRNNRLILKARIMIVCLMRLSEDSTIINLLVAAKQIEVIANNAAGGG